MTNQKEEVPSDSTQKLAQEVEVDDTTPSDSENPEDPISEESEVPKSSDAPAD
ncbi:hypothetical protein IQ230_00105 [Gloeocapsopsis crepidinum LEGE 06123]|uniref:Uncharacterized protein n=1 Tax=Gloeocapsopsis crepidinum LEGE 06123 TaxID=588587 RepID=A0ABR9UKI1_9CHRO|nr:hypothetical protein [Gloeocapsopsis crepidinum]MBE9188792.1 hypothetical protein [Gloeocapsopsis crepidinum LEGE 06123]